MVQPTQPEAPTTNRAITSATSAGTALLVSEGCKAYMLVYHPEYAGKAPQLAFALGVAAAVGVRAVSASLGSVAREQLVENPPKSFVAKLLLTIMSKAG